LRPYFKLAAYLLIGGLIGLVSAWAAIGDQYGLFRKQSGPWITWPNAGSPEADPYTIAHFARAGILPAKKLEVLYFYAKTDSAGQPILARCTYTISGDVLLTSAWSLTLYDGDGQLIRNPARRYGFNNRNVIRGPDGSYVIWLAPAASPGNWLPGGRRGARQLVLRLYNPDRGYVGAPEAVPLPQIKKTGCSA